MNELLFDWNQADEPGPRRGVRLMDETLRDGIQSPSVRNPSMDEKLEILHLMESCGIEHVNLGLPGAGAQAVEDVTRLAEEIVRQRMRISPCCAARTHPQDIAPILDITQRTGCPIEVCAFLGCSPLRREVEGWDLAQLEGRVIEAMDLAVKGGAATSFVTEDTTRTDASTLERLFRVALDHGASRLILTDTVGHATVAGQRRLLRWIRDMLARLGFSQVGLDWHGHNDRGLALQLCLSAHEEGVDRLHGTCLGIGERTGNASLDLLLVNLRLEGIVERDLRPLTRYVDMVSQACAVPIPCNYPVFGADALRTATGVHAAAIVKALRAGRPDLAECVYSPIPAGELGLRLRIDIGSYSGRSNISYWLEEHQLEPTEERIKALWEAAKTSRTTLSEEEILGCLRQAGLLS